jgi:hypothetical protein
LPNFSYGFVVLSGPAIFFYIRFWDEILFFGIQFFFSFYILTDNAFLCVEIFDFFNMNNFKWQEIIGEIK